MHTQWTREKRATPTERVLARVFVAKQAHASFDGFLRDTNEGVAASDGRRTEVLAHVLTRAGEPQRNATEIDGAVLMDAERDKEAKYSELAASGRYKLVVVASRQEVGGGCGLPGATLNLQGTGCPKFHAKICVPGLGAPMDSDAVCRVRHSLCRLSG